MAKAAPSRGFSMVEMLVALLFTGLLMAGMAQVFKSSLGSFTSSGEILSAARRNRSSIDLLYDDLNSAGMYLTDLSTPPLNLAATNPAFYILPNMPVTGVGADGPATADQIFFYFDMPLPFEGVLGNTGGIKTAADMVALGATPTAADNTFTIDCGEGSYADLLEVGQSFIFKDSWESRFISSISPAFPPRPRIVTVVVGTDKSTGVTGIGSAGGPGKVKHIEGSGILFFRPAQMVRYSIQIRNLDPQQPAGIPCLIREQGNYSPNGFVVGPLPGSASVITENVSGFKAYLSANGGQSWAGNQQTYTGFSAGWTSGLRADLNTQLGTSGRQDFKTTAGDENWFRQIPVLVRLDISTRTAVKRAEYYRDPVTGLPVANPPDAAFQNVTQSLVIVPRHFGLAMK